MDTKIERLLSELNHKVKSGLQIYFLNITINHKTVSKILRHVTHIIGKQI